MNINGKTAIITGGASGLGEATAVRFYKAGANLVLVDLQEEKGVALAKQLGDRAIFVKGDISSPEDARAVCQAAVAKFGKIDILINSAGIAAPGRAVGKEGPLELAKFMRVINVNLVGTFNMSSNVAVFMAKNEPEAAERGVIVNVASIAAYDGQIGQCAYAAAKGGIAAMTLPLARDLSRDGIRVNTIAPGIIDTPMMAKMAEPARQALSAQVLFPSRLGFPDEFAMLAEQLVLNGYINGECIRLDGGIRMQPK